MVRRISSKTAATNKITKIVNWLIVADGPAVLEGLNGVVEDGHLMLGIGHVMKNIGRLLTLSTEANCAVVKDRLGDAGLEKTGVLDTT